MSKRQRFMSEVRINTPSEENYTVMLLGLTFTVNRKRQPAQYKHIKRIMDDYEGLPDDFNPIVYSKEATTELS